MNSDYLIIVIFFSDFFLLFLYIFFSDKQALPCFLVIKLNNKNKMKFEGKLRMNEYMSFSTSCLLLICWPKVRKR